MRFLKFNPQIEASPIIEEPLYTFLREISSRIVVVGSVARGMRWPKDLDLIWDIDSEPAYEAIKRGIKKYNLVFESPFIRSWTFRHYGWMVEILGVHYGPDYRTTRRRATKQTISGIEFFVARPEDTPKVIEKPGEWIA